jgi:hypothetical protein
MVPELALSSYMKLAPANLGMTVSNVRLQQAFGEINSECLRIHSTWTFLSTHLPAQCPVIDHNCVDQLKENSKLPFLGSYLSEKYPCISVEKVNILEVALHRQLIAGHDIST